MPPSASSAALARLHLVLGGLILFATESHGALSIPVRPISFPLSRPTSIGELVAWGSNTFGQITIPPTATNVVAVAAGWNHNLALRSDGTVVAWGENTDGQCDVPLNLTDVVEISAAVKHSLALKSDGRVSAWGFAFSPPLTDAVSIRAINYNSLALRIAGTVVMWGTAASSYVPFGPWTNVVGLGDDDFQGVVLTADGSAWIDSSGPRIVGNVAALASGFPRMIAGVRVDGIPIGDFGFPAGFKAMAVASAADGTFGAISGDSSVAVWGSSTFLRTNMPPRLRGVFAISGGLSHFIALKLPTPPIPTTAVASAQIDHGFIVALNVIDGGEGYDAPPTVTITGGGGSGATATAQISRGVVTNFTMISAGSGYTSQPTFTIDPPPFLPKLSIAPSRVNVVLQVVPGKRYQLESSDDLPNFSPIGSPFTAPSNTITNEFTLSETGQFFRIQEVP
jgi:hypothetical protein